MPPNRALVFKSVPDGLPVAGEHFAVEPQSYDSEVPCPTGGIVVKLRYSSIDPYQRGRMRHPGVKYYSPALKPGDVFTSRGIASVTQSDHASYHVGQTVIGMLPIQEYVALEATQIERSGLRPLDNPLNIPDEREFLGALGIPGLTAYIGLHEIGKPAAGKTILVSAASGAVGQIVGQLAHLEGMRVLGSVGSPEKLSYLTSHLNFSAGFNYKTEPVADAIRRLAPEGLDIYYDNVGGAHLDAALAHMNDFGRIVMCGTISDYNNNNSSQARPAIYNYGNIFSRRLVARGFIVSDKGCADKYAREHQEKLQPLIKEGKIKTKIWEVQGIEAVMDGFLALFEGGNFGKAVLKY